MIAKLEIKKIFFDPLHNFFQQQRENYSLRSKSYTIAKQKYTLGNFFTNNELNLCMKPEKLADVEALT